MCAGMEVVYGFGRVAREQGSPLDACPYLADRPDGRLLATAWRGGWVDRNAELLKQRREGGR